MMGWSRRIIHVVVCAVFLGSIYHAAVGQPAPADVRFMQDMIHHHAQALEMTALVPDRSDSRAIDLIARRIEIAQQDEIAWMRDWLERRGEEVPSIDGHGRHGGDVPQDDDDARDRRDEEASEAGHRDRHGDEARHTEGYDRAADDRPLMPGILTEEQMAELADATGAEFDRRFLQFMTFHHEGALTMVRELLSTEGAAQEADVFTFAAEVDADQQAEIRRMQAVLDALPDEGSGR